MNGNYQRIIMLYNPTMEEIDSTTITRVVLLPMYNKPTVWSLTYAIHFTLCKIIDPKLIHASIALIATHLISFIESYKKVNY